MAKQGEIRVSDHFDLKKAQAELDFIDVPIRGDVPLFIDPYAFGLETDPWFVECNDLIIDFFSRLVESVRANRRDQASALLMNLHEPADTHLGFAQPGNTGRGIGRSQADELLATFTQSKAVKTGSLNDLSDCELLIPGISADKISDITTNIIRGHLLDYTFDQCKLHNIPVSRVAGGIYWDGQNSKWINAYANLPVVNNRRLVLVPKACVRFRPEITASEFYNHYVLNYLQAEHLRANDSLVQTLKNGKRIVLKKDLRRRYGDSKEFLFDFSQKHPDVLKQYKDTAAGRSRPILDEDLENFRQETREPDFAKLLREFASIPPGSEHASDYHNFIFGALQAIFYPNLRYPRKEEEIHEGRKRIDIIFNNGARSGFFEELKSNYGVPAPFIFFECKNYSYDPTNPELDQLSGRFSDRRGKFGVLVCRKIDNSATMLKRCKDAVNDNRGWMFVLDDAAIGTLLKLRAVNEQSAITEFMNEQMRRLLM